MLRLASFFLYASISWSLLTESKDLLYPQCSRTCNLTENTFFCRNLQIIENLNEWLGKKIIETNDLKDKCSGQLIQGKTQYLKTLRKKVQTIERLQEDVQVKNAWLIFCVFLLIIFLIILVVIWYWNRIDQTSSLIPYGQPPDTSALRLPEQLEESQESLIPPPPYDIEVNMPRPSPSTTNVSEELELNDDLPPS